MIRCVFLNDLDSCPNCGEKKWIEIEGNRLSGEHGRCFRCGFLWTNTFLLVYTGTTFYVREENKREQARKQEAR